MEPEFLYLTTEGWKSGNPHKIEIWFVSEGNCYYIVSEHRERSHWVQNIQHKPIIHVQVGDRDFHGTGRVIDPTNEPNLVTAVSNKMDAKYDWSEGLIVELCPNG